MRLNFGSTQTTQPPGHTPLVVNVVVVGPYIAGVPSSQALLGYLITAPVCVPAVIGGLALWRHNNKQKKSEEEEEGTGIASNVVKVEGEDLDTPGYLRGGRLGRDVGDLRLSWVRLPSLAHDETPGP